MRSKISQGHHYARVNSETQSIKRYQVLRRRQLLLRTEPRQSYRPRLGTIYNRIYNYVRSLSDNMGRPDTNKNSYQKYVCRIYRTLSIHEGCLTFFSPIKEIEFVLEL